MQYPDTIDWEIVRDHNGNNNRNFGSTIKTMLDHGINIHDRLIELILQQL